MTRAPEISTSNGTSRSEPDVPPPDTAHPNKVTSVTEVARATAMLCTVRYMSPLCS